MASVGRDFRPHRGALIGVEQTHDHHGALLAQSLRQCILRQHTLHRSVPQPQGQKRDGAHVPQGVHRPMHSDGLIQVRTSLEIRCGQMRRLLFTGHEYHLAHILF